MKNDDDSEFSPACLSHLPNILSLFDGRFSLKSPISLPVFFQESGSLTKKLRKAAVFSFKIKIISETFKLISPLRYPLLKLEKKEYAWHRIVHLCVDETVWVIAKTVIPNSALTRKTKKLLYLRDRPLGEYLFSDPHLKRSAFIFSSNSRTSLFSFYDELILLEEFFTDQAINYFQQKSF